MFMERYSKIIIIFVLSINIVFAKDSSFQAFVNRSNIDLYLQPTISSKKIDNYYKRGAKIQIIFCNKHNWCKTSNGFVKEYLIKKIKEIPTILKKINSKKKDNKYQKQIDNILKINNQLKNENISIKDILLKLKKENKVQNDFLDELDTNMGEIGRDTYANKVFFRVDTQFEVNQPNIKYADGKNRENESQIFRTRIRINMKSSINKYIKFYGRLSSYKNWGDSNEDKNSFASMDSRQGRTPDNTSAVYLERAYINWRVNPNSSKPIYLTIGRQPSSDGPSFQIKEETTRKGTYDALAFDGAADGIVLTYIENNYNNFRFAYGVPNNGNSYNENIKDTRVFGLFYDKKFKNLKYKHLVQLYSSFAKNMMGYPNLYDSNGTSLDKNLGDIYLYGAMFEIENINKFSYFIHYCIDQSKPNHNRVDLREFNMTDKEGLFTSGDDYSSKIGNAIWLGTRYDYNSKYSYGLEYNKGSKNWFSFAFASDDPINKLQTRGTAIEFYMVNKLTKRAKLTLGYIDIKYDYTNSGSWLGEAKPINSVDNHFDKKSQSNLYLKLNFKF